jgi:toxin ParE1/3/4
MKDNIGIRPQARMDVVELATYIGRDSVTAADRFLDACEATFDFLAESPEIGGVYPTTNSRLIGLRVFWVRDFPNHLALYVERSNSVEIIRVVHGARDLEAVLRDE